MITNEEVLDLFTFLDFARMEYCEICGWSCNVVTIGRHRVCRGCVERMILSGELCVCSDCGEVMFTGEANLINPVETTDDSGKVITTYTAYCDVCVTRVIRVCADCGMITTRANSVERSDGQYVCSSCASHYERCNDCGHLTNEPLIEGICSRCYDMAIWKGAPRRYGYHDWCHKWNFYGDDDKPKLMGESGVVYMGVELETDSNSDTSATTTLQGLDRRLKGLAHYERDGSLSSRGIEIITMPMTMSKHATCKEMYESTFKYLVKRGYTCDRHTGLHVHVSTGHLRNVNHRRLIYLLDKYKPAVVALSRRISSYAKYYSMNDILGRAPEYEKPDLEYCRDWVDDHGGHGIYLNFSDAPRSIEFRMFQGTLDINIFMASIQFVDTIIKAVDQYTLAQLKEMSFTDIFTNKFPELDSVIQKLIIDKGVLA